MRVKQLGIIILLMSFLLITTNCSNTPKPIRIGVNSWPPCEIWYIAQSQGFFEDTPVELVRFSAWSDNMSALYSGKIDITHSTYFNSVYYANKGESSKLWIPTDFSEGSDGLVIKKELKNIQSLNNKSIGVEIGTDEHYLLYKALLMNQIDIHDVQLVSLPSYDSHNAFINNEIDALFTYEPFLSQAAVEGNGKLCFTTKDIPGHMVDTLVIREDAYKSNAKAFAILKTAWYKSIDYIQTHPKEAFEILAKNENMSPKDFETFYNAFTFYSESEADSLMDSTAVKERLQEMADFCISEKLITTPTEIDKLILKD